MLPIFTIGHSSQPLAAFIALLQRHAVQVIADVRSRPGSRRFPHFSRERLQASLAAADIGYVFLGTELGARRDEPECYVDGQASYDRIATLPAFAAGIERPISHICRGGELEPHPQAEQRLVEEELGRELGKQPGRSDQADLFGSGPDFAQLVQLAYARRGGRIAYRAAPGTSGGAI
jgi:hypothetical protein